MSTTSSAQPVKKLAFISIVLLGVNGIIGSGAFLLPQSIYKDAGFVIGMATILVASVATIMIALCYADLAGKIDGSGGAWLYCYTAWGRYVGFQVALFVWFSAVITISTEVSALLRIFRNIVPALENHWISVGVGVVIVAILAVINLFSLKIVKVIDNLSSGVKIATAIFFIIAGAFFLKSVNFHPAFPGGSFQAHAAVSDFSSAYSVAFYLFTGFSFLTIAARQMKNPQKNLPRALVVVVLCVAVVYLGIQFMVVGNLGAGTANTTIPVATAMLHSLGEWAYYLVIAGTAVSVFGVAFATSFEAPILAASLSDEHNLLPDWIAKRNKAGSPWVAVLITSTLAAVLLLTGSYVFLATCVVCASAAQYIPTILATVKLRKLSVPKGTFRLKGAGLWIVVVLALVASSYLFVGFTWKVIVISVALLVVGTVIYFIERARGKHALPVLIPDKTVAAGGDRAHVTDPRVLAPRPQQPLANDNDSR